MNILDDVDFNLDLDVDINPSDRFEVENSAIKLNSPKEKITIFKSLKEKLRREVNEKLQHLVKPINAEVIKSHIPKKDESLFFLMNGNCEFVDYISEFIKGLHKDSILEVYLTTLSLNDHTFDSLDLILPNLKKNILVSSYFLATDRSNTLERMRLKKRLKKYNIGFFRNHTKLVLIKTKKNSYVFSGSANLRSSGTIEQFSVYNSNHLYDFNRKWINHLITKYNFNKKYNEIKNTGRADFDFINEI